MITTELLIAKIITAPLHVAIRQYVCVHVLSINRHELARLQVLPFNSGFTGDL